MGGVSKDPFHRMTRLERLLRPRSIAVVGGGALRSTSSGSRSRWSSPATSGRSTRPGPRSKACQPSAPSPTCRVPRTPPSSASIASPRSTFCASLRRASAGGAISFAAGFLEADDADGARLQRELVEAPATCPIIGPNCYGLINYTDGALLWPDQHGGRRLAPGARGAAIITQSSNIACNLTMQARGLPVAFLMTAGNQAQTGLSEMALGLIEDERVSVLGLHIEGFDSVRWLRAPGGPRARTEEADRRDEGRPLRAGPRGDHLAYGVAGGFRRRLRSVPEAPRHCPRALDPGLPRNAEASPWRGPLPGSRRPR